jgi:hypothetical protein
MIAVREPGQAVNDTPLSNSRRFWTLTVHRTYSFCNGRIRADQARSDFAR